MKKNISKSGSFEGYSFKKFFAGTWKTLKPLLIAGLAIGAYFVVPSGVDEVLKGLIAVVWGYFSTWVISGVEFYLKPVEL